MFTLSIYASSQEIVDSNKMWSSMEEHCQPWGSTYSTDYFRFDQDTLISDTIYKHVFISEDEDHENWNFYGAFIREEDNKVYYRKIFENEGLIYDFNLELGDSVLINNPQAVGEIYLQLAEIDSVDTYDGYKERWRLSSYKYPDSEYWIKGIGSETGVLNSSSGIFGGLCGLYTLLCQKYEDELVYMNPNYETCYLYVTGRDEVATEDYTFTLSYNSVKKSVIVNTGGNENKEIILASLSGKILDQIQTSAKSTSLNIGNSSMAVYIISVKHRDRIYTKKFIAY